MSIKNIGINYIEVGFIRHHAQAVNKLKQAAQQAGLINKAMDDHYKFNTDLAAQLASQNLAAFSLARFLSIASIVIAFVLTGILAAQLYLTIRTGLNQISQSLIRVSDTLNFRDRVEVKRQDEIGQATTALNRLLDKLQNSFHGTGPLFALWTLRLEDCVSG